MGSALQTVGVISVVLQLKSWAHVEKFLQDIVHLSANKDIGLYVTNLEWFIFESVTWTGLESYH